MHLKSFAKINLYLKILDRRKDGYHNIDTMMQTISLHDDLVFKEINKGIIINCNDPSIPIDEKNICFKAADLIIKKYKTQKGISISIRKNIPSGAGLGGGSSNAAATLVALNKLWNLKLSIKKLIQLAASLGADVPFFLIGGRCVCKGIGSRVKASPRGDSARGGQGSRGQGTGDRGQTDDHYYILIKPNISVSSKWAYEAWDKLQDSKRQLYLVPLTPYPLPFTPYPLPFTPYPYTNDLEQVIIPKYPIIQKIKDDLIHAGCSFAQMTGSGSAVFGVVKNKIQGNRIYKNLRGKYKKIFLVSEVN